MKIIKFPQVEYFSLKAQNISLKSASKTVQFYYLCTSFNINVNNWKKK
jgi:hypothetical protein